LQRGDNAAGVRPLSPRLSGLTLTGMMTAPAPDDLPELPGNAFAKADAAPDALFYREPRLVTHIDATAIAAVTALYRALLPPGGIVLDLMSSWVSHLPPEIAYAEVVGQGMNDAELAANPRLTRRFVQDLNQDPALPLGSASVDAALICVSIQYLQQPVAVLREVGRVLRPGGVAAITFSNRCFPTKAVAIWQALAGPDQCRLVALYLGRAGFGRVEARQLVSAAKTDPLWGVWGYVPATAGR
jgi:SAM-dependent methyltransferase